MREKTTKKQRELLSYLDIFIKQNNFSPSYREIMQAMGYKSVSTVANHVNNLIERGYLKKGRDGIRTLEVVPAPSASDDHKTWLKRTLDKKRREINEVKGEGYRSDLLAIDRVAKMLGLE